MANLPTETVETVFYLQRQLWELIDEATKTEWMMFDRFGETDETTPELEQLKNAAERLRKSYSRLHNLMLQVAESQPMAILLL